MVDTQREIIVVSYLFVVICPAALYSSTTIWISIGYIGIPVKLLYRHTLMYYIYGHTIYRYLRRINV